MLAARHVNLASYTAGDIQRVILALDKKFRIRQCNLLLSSLITKYVAALQ
ncbi:hypothetical protein APHWI1_0286 [Anaplasma phagocytophilum str. ApWI1]|uniref:Uncharacterized protein n=2 Tax=Anaplasma phagocytophilum TaxID=948 RepID=A0A0F3N560_ANAPH|nr:hypothetical protein APHWEB_1230 [Anaplasma phagocytophilum str. Webster]KJV63195.1 hypothetical protein EPHNCH_1108 [Anaplasma phagocytophilum str. NCH-1]KJV82527.1 hypothetical protein APHHGE2_1085 [Anaplasma phagocytophilum str. HGE2]KJV85317.1 hypothetical protein APHWI1_0286 [Anaplasma phagocytophilum str. ApWI1]KJV98846.1 hypothetical protein OTSANNIE_1058 [Anaplasma phagocytophilum str. Annie]KJZ99036.1 hypothetical protein APHCR_0294 [Anaplasma phagocytophilum str. CR1007]KKA00066.